MKKILLVDGNHLMYRSYFATMRYTLTAPDGTPTNAIYGFIQTLFKIIAEENPTHIAVGFDISSSKKRMELYPEYKAGRLKMPEDLSLQFPIVKEIIGKMGITIVEKEGIEADDILGSISKLLKEEMQVCILTGDRDYFQLVDEKIYIRYPKMSMGKTEYVIYDKEEIMKKYEVSPKSMIQVKAIMGDASDNIPGVKGIGEKGAIKLVKEYGSVENIYLAIDEGKDNISKGVKTKLLEDRQNAFLSLKLGEIEIDENILEELKINVEDLKYTSWKNDDVYSIFKKLNFKKFLEKFEMQEEITKDEELEKYTDLKKKTKSYTYLETKEEKVRKEIKERLKKAKEVYVHTLIRKKAPKIEDENPLKEEIEKNIEENILENSLAKKRYAKEFEDSISKYIVDKIVFMIFDEEPLIFVLDIEDEMAKEILKNKEIAKIGHGLKRLFVNLKERKIQYENFIFDTKIAAYLLNSDIGKYEIYETVLREISYDLEKEISKENEIFEKYFNIAQEQLKAESKYIQMLIKMIKNEKEVESTNIAKNIYENIYTGNLSFEQFITRKEEIEDIFEEEKLLKKDIKELKTLKKIIDEITKEKRLQEEISNMHTYIPLFIYLLKLKQEEKIEKENMNRVFYEIEIPSIEVLAEMQYSGIYLNVTKLKELKEKYLKLQKELTDKIYVYAEKEINLNSPQQVGELLFEKLKLSAIKKTKKGYSTDAEILKKLESKHEVVPLILEYREITKLLTTYIDPIIEQINGKTKRIHSDFHQTVTGTGRISSTEPNMQNIPARKEQGREIRLCFEAQDEKYFVGADYSQIELRVLADLSNDENMKKAFSNNEDIHRSTASNIFNVPINEVTSELRGYAKAVNFGIIYGISDYGLSENVRISVEEARRYINQYLTYYKGVKEYMDNIKEFAKKNGYVETKFGRRRYIENINSRNYHLVEHAKRMAMNAPIQGTSADVTKLAIIYISDIMKKNKMESKVVLQIHDEIIIESTFEEKEKVGQMLVEAMKKACEIEVDVKVDLKESKTLEK